MKRMMARLAGVVVIAALFCGCASKRVAEKPEVKPAPPPMPVPEELVEASRPLKFLVMWYYRACDEWPGERGDLEKFLRMLNAPLTLEHYPGIKFDQVSDDEIECRFLFDAPREMSDSSRGTVPACRVSGIFRLATADAVADGIDHVGLETLLTVEAMRLPEKTPPPAEPSDAPAGTTREQTIPAAQPDLTVLDEMTQADAESREEQSVETGKDEPEPAFSEEPAR